MPSLRSPTADRARTRTGSATRIRFLRDRTTLVCAGPCGDGVDERVRGLPVFRVASDRLERIATLIRLVLTFDTYHPGDVMSDVIAGTAPLPLLLFPVLTPLVLVFDIAQTSKDLANLSGLFLRNRRQVTITITAVVLWISHASREVGRIFSGESCRCSLLLKPLNDEVLKRVINLKPEVAPVGFRLLLNRQQR